MMKLYQLSGAVGYFRSRTEEERMREADAAQLENCWIELGWHYEASAPLCTSCGRILPRRTFPAIAGLVDGQLVDFANTGRRHFVASRTLLHAMSMTFSGFSVRDILTWSAYLSGTAEFQEIMSFRYPALGRESRKEVTGQVPAELYADTVIDVTKTESTYEVVGHRCSTCGRLNVNFTGIEQLAREIVDVTMPDGFRMIGPTARVKGHGLIVRASQLADADIFTTNGGWLIVTESVKSYLESRSTVNVRFLEVGEIID
jgi:hypothetical protein